MNWPNIKLFIGISAWVTALFAILLFLNIGRIDPIEGTHLVSDGQLCVGDECAAQSLPYHSKMRNVVGVERQDLQFNVILDELPNMVQALYIPKLSDDAQITLNGHALRVFDKDMKAPKRYWNRPNFITVPTSLLVVGVNNVQMSLAGYPQEGVDLYPFYLGPAAVLEPAYNWRYATSVYAARFGLGIMLVLSIALGALALSQKINHTYLWLCLSCLAACIILIHYSMDTSHLPYKLWSGLWPFAISAYVYAILKFSNRFLNTAVPTNERPYLVFLCLYLLSILIVPEAYSFTISTVLGLGTGFFAINILMIYWRNRTQTKQIDFYLLFSCLSLAVALGFYTLCFHILNDPPRNQPLFHFMPIIMTSVCLWMIVSDLIQSLTRYEALTQSQQQTIEDKTQELTDSFEKLALAEKSKVIDEERKRIMLDLHDGLGGQLVSALAYMENKQVVDKKLKTALEDALRDLALMLDSLETEDSISTLLGMLRTRLEDLLAEHGLEFNWQIADEPKLPQPGPSQNLNLLRIVQEAITNVIKHGKATHITIASDSTSVTITDNGKGFDIERATQENTGHGIMGMQNRAKQIGAIIELSSSSAGSSIKLIWR